MNPEDNIRKKLEQRQESETDQTAYQQNLSQGNVFQSPEELIRADRDSIQIPSGLKPRVDSAISEKFETDKPWWKKLF